MRVRAISHLKWGDNIITVLEPGETVIGIEDGCLITSHRIVDAHLIPPLDAPMTATEVQMRMSVSAEHKQQIKNIVLSALNAICARILASHGLLKHYDDPDGACGMSGT